MEAPVLILVSAIVAALRIAGFTDPVFQAAAHLWVGVLAGAWWVGRPQLVRVALTVFDAQNPADTCFRLAVALSAVELACFLLRAV